MRILLSVIHFHIKLSLDFGEGTRQRLLKMLRCEIKIETYNCEFVEILNIDKLNFRHRKY